MVGTLEMNRKQVMPLIDKFRLHGKLSLWIKWPQTEVYKLLQAHALAC